MKNHWPALHYEQLKDTVTTVQLWTQIVGKIRLSLTPWINHSWHVTLYISPVGLTTGNIPFENGIFRIEFDFIHHQLLISSSTGKHTSMDLYPRSVANFYRELMDKLSGLGIEVSIYPTPNETDPAIPFEEDESHCSYDPSQMNSLWQAWTKIEPVFTRFRAKFVGKCSPVHLFWGAFDVAVTRFSGRKAPAYAGAVVNIPLEIMQEAYSHEVSSAGFWPGSDAFPQPVFYSYCYPTPEAFGKQPMRPEEAFFNNDLGEFFLPYDAVSNAADPEYYLMEFLQSTYEAAAKTGDWDRESLVADFSKFERRK